MKKNEFLLLFIFVIIAVFTSCGKTDTPAAPNSADTAQPAAGTDTATPVFSATETPAANTDTATPSQTAALFTATYTESQTPAATLTSTEVMPAFTYTATGTATENNTPTATATYTASVVFTPTVTQTSGVSEFASFDFSSGLQGWTSTNCFGFSFGGLTALTYDTSEGHLGAGSAKINCVFGGTSSNNKAEAGVYLSGITAPASPTGRRYVFYFSLKTSYPLPAGYSIYLNTKTNGSCGMGNDYTGSSAVPAFSPSSSDIWTAYSFSTMWAYTSLDYIGIRLIQGTGANNWSGTVWIDDVRLVWY